MTQRCGEDQRLFIKHVRTEIDMKQHGHFVQKDWRNITPKGGKCIGLTADKKFDTQSFCVKPVASWVPHLSMPNHVPTCPRCLRNTHVDVAPSHWIKFPKTLHGIKSHKHLDTKFCPCRSCGQDFNGFNKQSLAADAKSIVGFFNFYLAEKFAADEELHSFVVNAPDTSSARIAKHLQKMTADNHFADC